MKIHIKLVISLILFIIAFACSSDDESDIIIVPERDRAEQQITDNGSIIGYLETHYYNSGDYVGVINPSIDDLVITELPTGDTVPTDHTLLMDAVETHETFYEETDYKYYILRLNQGGGTESPNFTDDVRVKYTGNLLDEEIFDSVVTPADFDLINLVPGWNRVMPQFNISVDTMINPDGTVSFNDSGVGVMFLPSGLGAFSGTFNGNISAYSPLIFKFELYQTNVNDHDSDNVPSYLEDLNGNLDLDDDTDGDLFADFIDSDDDNDGVLTINEDLEDTDLTVDSDGDGDPTNDKNGDGNPLNDDSDGDGVPNYLDTDSTESKDS